MKRRATVALVMAALLIGFSAAALAADTNTVAISTSVTGTCRFNSANSSLAFTLDASSSSDVTATSTTTFWCTKTTSYTLSKDNGLYNSGGMRMKHSTLNEYIPYAVALSPTSGAGAGKSTGITLSISGTVVNANYINASAGSYADTVTLTLTP